MSALAHAFPSYSGTVVNPLVFQYPSSLSPLRDTLLDLLPSDEAGKVAQCRYRSHCNSIYCPLCCRQAGYAQKDKIIQSAGKVDQKRLRFGTFTVKDVPLDALREAGATVLPAVRSTLKRLRVDGAAIRLEVSDPETEDYHPHVHALIDSPASGRSYISKDTLQDAWLSELPAWLQSSSAGLDVGTVRDFDATCTYLAKSPFSGLMSTSAQYSLSAVTRIVDSITALKGLHKFSTFGSMTSSGRGAPMTSLALAA